MDLIKIGKFLQELRREKGLTQEQLAEKTGVARRTVSRWETGSNMPDMDILIELSDLYSVDLREILSGERKSEQMNEELKETVLQVADYSNEEKSRLVRRMHWLFIAGLFGFIVFLLIALLGLDSTPPYEAIGSFGLGIAFGMIIIGVIFTSRYAAKIREFKYRLLGKAKENSR
ncbi:MAG: helix-turn-helix domain-containing protein [Erysipelotrichaceae bacterium]|nr:helix-turn-helix domain-containing protein [Erysipelotrichaceae bacterium]